MKDKMIIDRGGGIVECRICGQMFVAELEEDRESHEGDHRRIMCGAMPYDVRELLKRAGWEAAEDKNATEQQRETGKRAVVFGWWMRALWNGVPENDCDEFMKAHLALVDASISGDKEERAKAAEAVRRWQRYG